MHPPRHPQRTERSETRNVVGEELFAFGRRVNRVPERTRHVYNLVGGGDKLWSVANTQLHTGTTRCWNQNGRCPLDMEPQGIKVLGTPVRIHQGSQLLDAIPDPRFAVCVASPSEACRTPIMPPNHCFQPLITVPENSTCLIARKQLT